MARGKMDVATRLERQEKKILKMAEELEQAKEEYKKLQEEKKKEDIDKITAAYIKSKRTLDEVLDFLKGKADIQRGNNVRTGEKDAQ